MTLIMVRLRDRPGGLDRLVGTCRRRQYPLRTLSMGPPTETADPDERERVVTLTLGPCESPVSRIEAQLRRIVDVLSVVTVTVSDRPPPVDGTPLDLAPPSFTP